MARYIEAWLEKYPSIKKFEKLLERGRITPRTLEGYVSSVKEFCELIDYKEPEGALEYIKKIVDKEEWLDSLIEETRGKITDNRIINIMKGVKKWLEMNKVDVEWRDVILPSKEVMVEDRAPTKEELRHILNFCNIRDKAYLLVASSSGLRANTLRTLKFGDVNFDYPDVARIIVKKRYEIEGEAFRSGRKISRKRSFFVTFITPEAKKSLLEYKEWREKEGETITEDSPLFTSMRREELGQFLSRKYLSVHWGRILKKAHLTDKSAEWFVIHFHTLKKYAETQFINAGVIPSYREFWLGHLGSYLESSYFRGEEPKHLEEYRKAIPHVELRERTPTISKEDLDRAIVRRIVVLQQSPEQALEELALEHGMTVEGLRNILAKLKPTEKEEEGILKRHMVVAKRKEENEDCQKIVNEEELADHLAKGWKVSAVLPSGKVVIEK